jgi:hypothetical protein
MSSPLVFSGVCVTRSFVLCVCFVDRCLSFCPFLLAIVLSVLRFTFGIFKLFEFFDQINMKIFSETAVNLFQTRLGLSLGGLLLKSYPTTQPQTKMANVKKKDISYGQNCYIFNFIQAEDYQGNDLHNTNTLLTYLKHCKH